MDKVVFNNQYQKNGVQIHEIIRQLGKNNFHSVVLMDGDVAFELFQMPTQEAAAVLFEINYFEEEI
jgi:hypothetical protein